MDANRVLQDVGERVMFKDESNQWCRGWLTFKDGSVDRSEEEETDLNLCLTGANPVAYVREENETGAQLVPVERILLGWFPEKKEIS